MSKKNKKAEEAPVFVERKLPDTLPELKEVSVEPPKDADGAEVLVVLSAPFRLNGKLFPAGKPVSVPKDAAHHMPVKARL